MRSILAFFAFILMKLLRATWRVELLGPAPEYDSGPLVFCFWHGRQAGLLAHPRPRPVTVLASMSRDGTLQARVLSLLGYRVHRGSSSRGGASGLKALVAELQRGCDAAFAVDGPRGPIHKVKPGALEAAKLSNAGIVPITTKASSAWVFEKAWDKYLLPKPFARVELVRGKTCRFDATDAKEIEKTLSEL